MLFSSDSLGLSHHADKGDKTVWSKCIEQQERKQDSQQ